MNDLFYIVIMTISFLLAIVIFGMVLRFKRIFDSHTIRQREAMQNMPNHKEAIFLKHQKTQELYATLKALSESSERHVQISKATADSIEKIRCSVEHDICRSGYDSDFCKTDKGGDD